MDSMNTDTTDTNDYIKRAAVVSADRADLVASALTLRAPADVLEKLVTAVRVNADPKIGIMTRYGHLSRGKCWGRQGNGKNVTWAEKANGIVYLTPGVWTVGSDDGFKRRDSDVWTVEHVTVGQQTWTIANELPKLLVVAGLAS